MGISEPGLGICPLSNGASWSCPTVLVRLSVKPGSIALVYGCNEQLMKRVATGRKNWLFKGSLAAGERAANLMTIIGLALPNDLDGHAYLEDALRRALAGETDWESMAPHVWKTEHSESIRVYRAEERRQAADRKRTTRTR